MLNVSFVFIYAFIYVSLIFVDFFYFFIIHCDIHLIYWFDHLQANVFLFLYTDMAHYLLRTEGLFVGSSSAMNVICACNEAKKMKKNSTIVTIICDNGSRHLSRFWNPDYIEQYGLVWPSNSTIPACLI